MPGNWSQLQFIYPASGKMEDIMSAEENSRISTYLTFGLGEETFAFEVNHVREVLDLSEITRVPRTPDFMRGVINLRGNVVPVVDLKLKFDMPQTEKTINTCIIIVEVEVDSEPVVLGALADSVQEVIEIEPQNIEPAPRIGTNMNIEFLKGMGKKDDDFLMILDIDKVFSIDDIAVVQDKKEWIQPEEQAE